MKLPGRAMLGVLEAGSRAHLPVPTAPDEVRSAMLWWTYRNTRAKQELGFRARPHEETLTDAVRWQMEELGDRVGEGGGPEQRVIGALGKALQLGERVVRR